ncbi:MAG: Gfo/Idh/MocA family oxidoreductase [Candidatus Bathyarchaeota archaeon]|nr:Gfo/Idh/MocA family oxidoreductase [Candidatus Bathyarchaeota archaeon]
MQLEKIRLGVVGIGKMGLLHASIVNTLPNVELVALCDKSNILNRIGKKMFSPTGVSVVDDIEKFKDLNLQVVYVTTPIASHSFLVSSLLKDHLAENVFCEKTLALTYAQSKELCELANKAGSVNMVGYMKRFNVVFGKAKSLLEQKELGDIVSFKSFAYSSDFQGLTKESQSSASRGGALRDIGCHIIDMSLWLLGDLAVNQVLSCVKSGEDAETSVSFSAKTSSGVPGVFEVSQNMENYRMPEFGLSIECEKGTIAVNDDRIILTEKNGDQKKLYRQDLSDSVPFYLGESEYYRENAHFIDAVRQHKQASPSFDDASKVDYIIEQVKTMEGQ